MGSRRQGSQSSVAAFNVLLLLYCWSGFITAQTEISAAEGDLRLADGPTSSEGRVEILTNATWRTVCSDGWDQLDTNVVCRQLNLPFTRALFRIYPSGEGPVFLNNVGCTGSEARLLDCDANEEGNSPYCDRIGVGCYDEATTNGNLRLVGGSSEYEGRVEIFINGSWGTVCDDRWDDNNAAVVCRQLGFNNSVAVFAGESFGPGSGTIWLDDVECTGVEDSLLVCRHRPVGDNNCLHREDAGVFCSPINEDIPDGSVRLVGGSNQYEGQVQVFLSGAWGTVCDDNWDDLDASVVCKQLNLTTSRPEATVRARFGAGAGRILLDEVRCSGQESRLIDCPNDGVMNHNCRHSEDAGVICRPDETAVCINGAVQLINGNSSSEGRVEICIENNWKTACSDPWTAREARVICRQLKLPHTNATVLRSAYFGEGTSYGILGHVLCHGREASISACRFNDGPTCGHEEDVGVRCLEAGEFTADVGEVRLIGGRTALEGRVEVFSDYGTWGTVCDDSWDERDAAVVCRQLGFPTEGAMAFGEAIFGSGAPPQFILLDEVGCSGDENRLVNCSHRGINIHDCLHAEDACVRCPLPPVPGPAVNIRVSPSTVDCSQVTISWDMPTGYEFPNLISNYTISITATEQGGLTLMKTSKTSRIEITSLPCGLSFVCFVKVSVAEVGAGMMSNAIIFETPTAEALLGNVASISAESGTQGGATEQVKAASVNPVPIVALLTATLLVLVVVVSVVTAAVVCYKRKKRLSSNDVEDSSRVDVTSNKYTVRRESSLASTGQQMAESTIHMQLRQDITSSP